MKNFPKKSFFEKLKSIDNQNLFMGKYAFNDIHCGKLFTSLFKTCYSKYSIIQNFRYEELFSKIIKHYSIQNCQVIRFDIASDDNIFQFSNISESVLILKEGFILHLNYEAVDIYTGPNILESEKHELLTILNDFIITKFTRKKCYIIKKDSSSLCLSDFDLKLFDLDVETHFNDDFKETHELIINSLTEKRKNGLILLHGKYGSGKTYYLRYLMSKIDRRFIYFPLDMLESINSPELFPFLSNYPDSILILEDCESLLLQRENGHSNSSAISNLLNLGDGLLSDALSLNVICTFNTNLKKLDDAILRKGRLIARYEFKELEIPKAQMLANQLGMNIQIEKPMTVSDIYNIDKKSYENTPMKTVGFKVA